jgi:hypothetical protein
MSFSEMTIHWGRFHCIGQEEEGKDRPWKTLIWKTGYCLNSLSAFIGQDAECVYCEFKQQRNLCRVQYERSGMNPWTWAHTFESVNPTDSTPKSADEHISIREKISNKSWRVDEMNLDIGMKTARHENQSRLKRHKILESAPNSFESIMP